MAGSPEVRTEDGSTQQIPAGVVKAGSFFRYVDSAGNDQLSSAPTLVVTGGVIRSVRLQGGEALTATCK